QVGLRPQGPELPGAGTEDRDRLVRQRGLELRPRRPVDRVLQAAGDGAVVLGRREEDRVRRLPLLAEAADGRRNLIRLEILVVDRQLADSLPQLELDGLR